MASGFEDALLDELNDLILKAEAMTLLGADLYFALGEAGSEIGTTVWTDYARVAVTRNGTNFGASSGGAATTLTVITFSAGATVVAGPQDVDELRLYSASSAGTLLGRGALSVPKSINNGDPVSVPIGDADFTFNQAS
jgi:hypothetical protein